MADFGIARIAAEASITTVGHVLGTAAYLPPEQAIGRPATPDGDRYSLAVLAYELLTGTRPFDGDRLVAPRDARAAFRPPPASIRNPSLPPAVDAVLARGLARVPTRRWPSATELVRRLERAVIDPDALGQPAELGQAAEPGQPTVVAEPPTQVSVPTKPPAAAPFVAYGSRRHRPPAWAVPVAAIAAVALAAGIAIGADGGADSRAKAGAARRKATAAARVKPPSAAPKRAQGSGPRARAAGTTLAPTPSELDAAGHAMMLAGNYTGAIAAMRQVLSETSSGSLLHAYALFDLGRSLRLSGDPQAAIPVLEERLQYPNQTGAARAELLLAERAAGLLPAAGPGSGGHGGHGPNGQHGHGHGPGGPPGPGGQPGPSGPPGPSGG